MPFIYVARCLNRPPEPGVKTTFREAITPAEILDACKKYNMSAAFIDEGRYTLYLRTLSEIAEFKQTLSHKIPTALQEQMDAAKEPVSLPQLKVQAMLEIIRGFIPAATCTGFDYMLTDLPKKAATIKLALSC